MPEAILRRARVLIKRLLGLGLTARRVKKMYTEKEYLEAYSQHTDLRVDADPHAAVGGLWEELGKLQCDFLIQHGLRPHHTLLDIGCGTLRGGRHLIRYLDHGNYSGMDISPKAIAYARQLVEQEGLAQKAPRLLVSSSRDLRFLEFAAETFDCVLAHSVFSQLKPEHIEECFENVGRIMHDDSVFYFSYNDSPEFEQTGPKDFCQPSSFFESLAEHYRFSLKDCSDQFNHPRGQRMIEVRKK